MRANKLSALLFLAACSQDPQATNPDLAQSTSTADLRVASTMDLAQPAGPDMAQAAVGATVVLRDDFYMPNMVTIKAGQKVKWSWQAAGAHGVDSVDNKFPDSGFLMSGNTTYEHTFTTPGTYPVQCLVHGAQMPLTIVVQ